MAALPASSVPTRAARRALRGAAFACAVGAATGGARAAADDVNAPPPVVAPAPLARATDVVLAFGRQLVDGVLATERSVVDAIAASTPAPEAWGIDIRGADFPLGARWRMLQGDADTHVPCASWMADVQPVTGTSFFHGDTLRPSLHLSAEWALGGDFSLGVMPGVAIELDPQGRREVSGTLAIALGKEWVPGWRTFVDIARDRVALEQGGGASTTLDAGVSIAAGAATQVDIAVAHGLTAAAPALQAGVGVSSRF